ncbi:MAG: hypothetical protein DKINENOH_04320 [bacterium]|nr:hypothetical protein [bacterium]
MRLGKTVLLATLLLGLGAVPASSQIVKKGQVGFRFLENPVSAEAVGRGGLGVAMFRNANAVFWNPGALSWFAGRLDFNVNHTNGIADINHTSAVGAYHWNGVGFFALDLITMDYGDFYGTRRANNDQGFEDTGTFSPNAWALGLTFSQKVSDRFSYGVHLKYARQDLGDAWIATAGKDVNDPGLAIAQRSYAQGEAALDIGAIYDFLYHGVRFGAVIQNISREVRYEEEKFPLPFAVSFSLTVDPWSVFRPEDKNNSLVIGFESRHPRDFKEKIKVGAEYQTRKMFRLRAGYADNYDERGLTAGLGVNTSMSNTDFRLDYAYQDFGIFGGVHLFSFGVTY